MAPQDRHWISFFSWMAMRVALAKSVGDSDRQRLLRAYSRLKASSFPTRVDQTTPWLLSKQRTLHSFVDLASGRLVEDDHPALAAALLAAGAKVAFADLCEETRDLFANLGLKRLTEICPSPQLAAGPKASAPSWFVAAQEAKYVGHVQRPDIAMALHELAWTQQRRSRDFSAVTSRQVHRRLASLTGIDFVTEVRRVYRLAGKSVFVPEEAAIIGERIVCVSPRTKFDFEQMLAYALAEMLGATKVANTRSLASLILPLFACQSQQETRSYLGRQGIELRMSSGTGDLLDTAIAEVNVEDPTEQILRQVVEGLNLSPTSASPSFTGPSPPTKGPPKEQAPTRAAIVLPDIKDVHVSIVSQSDRVIPRRETSSNGGGRNTGWVAPTAQDHERDQKVGDRGEALVYQLELDRLARLGHAEPSKLVIWTSQFSPGADHDIQSIGDDGKPIWIEVKSTTGTDGRFEWSKQEFEKALREGKRYEIWRVYEAHTDHPTIKTFKDPAKLMAKSQLQLELGSLRAVVEPMKAG